MSAIFKQNQDNSYTLHMEEYELKALIGLMGIVYYPFTNKPAQAVLALQQAISNELGIARYNEIWDNEVFVSLYAPDAEDDPNGDEWQIFFDATND